MEAYYAAAIAAVVACILFARRAVYEAGYRAGQQRECELWVGSASCHEHPWPITEDGVVYYLFTSEEYDKIGAEYGDRIDRLEKELEKAVTDACTLRKEGENLRTVIHNQKNSLLGIELERDAIKKDCSRAYAGWNAAESRNHAAYQSASKAADVLTSLLIHLSEGKSDAQVTREPKEKSGPQVRACGEGRPAACGRSSTPHGHVRRVGDGEAGGGVRREADAAEPG